MKLLFQEIHYTQLDLWMFKRNFSVWNSVIQLFCGKTTDLTLLHSDWLNLIWVQQSWGNELMESHDSLKNDT